MAGQTMTSRLEKKDNLIASLREKVTTLKAQNKDLRAAARGKGRTATANTASTGKSRRPASSKGRAGARARSTRRKTTEAAPAAA
jgi:hypothetical protein